MLRRTGTLRPVTKVVWPKTANSNTSREDCSNSSGLSTKKVGAKGNESFVLAVALRAVNGKKGRDAGGMAAHGAYDFSPLVASHLHKELAAIFHMIRFTAVRFDEVEAKPVNVVVRIEHILF